MSDSNDPRLYFQLFNEIGIIEQLSRALFEARLPDGVLVSHFSVLNHMVRLGDGRTPLDLSRAFQVPKTTMSHTLMLLEKRDWIEMRPNPDDKRSKQVWLTDAGRAFREEAIGALAGEMAWLPDAFSPAEAQALLPNLERLRKVLDERRG
ncbi:MarR family winged helix-turn-helix transcriptional regulator [Hasllibacter sp. MH4015]|uniref:MarR family winged helix-turn-helix transcriptional regulator n=1 Tax=Hasllibacter sp. MH4015 TaxID=2854029 RepID=UPI001CD34D12|nr:MarR family transcriptional regulator [Hasllibacter sp. MH4015]